MVKHLIFLRKFAVVCRIRTLAFVALDGVTTTASTSGLAAVAGEMTWFAAVVAVSTAATAASTATSARALARDVTLLETRDD